MVFFQGQDNDAYLYQYLDDFIALYLTEGLNHTVGDDIQWWPEHHTYLEGNPPPPQLQSLSIENTFIGTLRNNPQVLTKASLSLPSMRSYFPMTIISIKIKQELAKNTTFDHFLIRAAVNQNHPSLHHLQGKTNSLALDPQNVPHNDSSSTWPCQTSPYPVGPSQCVLPCEWMHFPSLTA